MHPISTNRSGTRPAGLHTAARAAIPPAAGLPGEHPLARLNTPDEPAGEPGPNPHRSEDAGRCLTRIRPCGLPAAADGSPFGVPPANRPETHIRPVRARLAGFGGHFRLSGSARADFIQEHLPSRIDRANGRPARSPPQRAPPRLGPVEPEKGPCSGTVRAVAGAGGRPPPGFRRIRQPVTGAPSRERSTGETCRPLRSRDRDRAAQERRGAPRGRAGLPRDLPCATKATG